MKSKALHLNKGIIFGFISTALGAMITILYKPMMMQGMPAITIALIESFTLALLLLALCKPWRLFNSSKKIWYPIFISSFSQAIGGISFFFGLSHLDPVTFSFLTRNQAIFSIVFGYLFLSERHNIWTWIFIVFAVVGSLTLCYADINTMNLAGVTFAFLFCLSFGIRNFTLRKYPRIPVLINLFYGYLLSIIFLLPVAFFSDTYTFHSVSLNDILWIIVISIFASFGTLYFFQLALRNESVSIISPLRLFSPYMVALYFGWEIGYSYTPDKMLGMCIMTLAIMSLIYSSKLKYDDKVASRITQ